MVKVINFILWLGLLTVAQPLSAQIFVGDYDPPEYRSSVKQIEEFMKRFNLEERNEVFDSEPDLTKRQQLNIKGLFNYELVKSRGPEVEQFVEQVLAHHIKLQFSDTTWIAIARCKATYQGKNAYVTLTLGTEYIGDYMYKWVIKDAEGDMLRLLPQKGNPGLKISPTDNEINFMSLSHITTVEAKNILNYKASFRPVDQLSVFFSLVANGLLKIQNVEELTYRFVIPGLYEFEVKEFLREALNSGWLISDFKKINYN